MADCVGCEKEQAMGSWGPGPFENDHAMDLLSIETARWASELREALDDPDTSWDDLEGLLVYVPLVTLAGKATGMRGMLTEASNPESSRGTAQRWKRRFLEIEATLADEPGFKKTPAFGERRRAVASAFNALIRIAVEDDAPTPAKKRRRKR